MADEAELRAWLLAGLKGDQEAHRAFLSGAAGLLRGFFRNRLRGAPEDAEDLLQETLIALHAKRDTYDPSLPVTAWMYAIARYRLIDHLRRVRRRGPHNSLDEIELGDSDPEFAAACRPPIRNCIAPGQLALLASARIYICEFKMRILARRRIPKADARGLGLC